MKKYLDTGSWVVAIATLVLFALALFMKGFTRDLLLEGGIFLVSVKIILGSYRNSLDIKRLDEKLDTLIELSDGRK
jgi:hypothetical protein